MVSRLNSLNQPNGHSYTLYQFETFDAATSFLNEGLAGSYVSTVAVAHGIFIGDVYSGNLKEVNGARPEAEVNGNFNKVAHCGETDVDQNDVGQIAASANPGDSYSAGSGAGGSGGGGGGGSTGYWQYYTSQQWVYYKGSNGHLASYLTTVTVAVWYSTSQPGGPKYQI